VHVPKIVVQESLCDNPTYIVLVPFRKLITVPIHEQNQQKAKHVYVPTTAREYPTSKELRMYVFGVNATQEGHVTGNNILGCNYG
jgi:hypothetical protein